MNDRQYRLLAEIKTQGGKWPTGRVMDWYRAQGIAPKRRTARRDLETLANRGYLTAHGSTDSRTYTL